MATVQKLDIVTTPKKPDVHCSICERNILDAP